MNKGCRLTELQGSACAYCIYRTKWMKFLSVTSTTNEQEYGRKERDVAMNYFMSSKVLERAK